jgi:regulator of PEP synthase PpsR (kinase-PPPase family)
LKKCSKQKGNVKWNVTNVIDSTTLSVEEVAKVIADWIASEVKKQNKKI